MRLVVSYFTYKEAICSARLNVPDSREPWFICEAHAQDDSLPHTLGAFEQAVDTTITKLNNKASNV